MRRIFLQEPSLTKGPVVIKDKKAHYLSVVLRSKTGDCLIVTDKKGKSYTAQIRSVSKREVTAEITGDFCINTESNLSIILLQGLLKGDKMDFVIQKTTELGVRVIIPLITEKSQVRATRKTPRWRNIAEDASRQSGRSIVPEIFEPLHFADIFTLPCLNSGNRILFWERGGESLSSITDRLNRTRKISLLTGPEGGFSENEVTEASANGFLTATLGSRILRAETASIAAVALMQFSLGDLGSQTEQIL